MPNINIPIEDLMSSVERPVIFDVIRQMMLLTGISYKTAIRFYGDDAKGAQFGSYLTKEGKAQNLWPHMENVTIEVEEDFNPAQMLTMAVKEADTPYIFADPKLNVTIKPAYSSTDVVIRVIFNGKDKNQATRWRNAIRTRTAMGREINLHTLTYSWHFPEVCAALIEHVYDLRSAVGSYSDTLEEYWGKYADERFTLVTNQIGEKAILMVAEKQTEVQGLFDFEGAPEKAERANEPDQWSVSFAYKFRYDKPIDTVCRYPLLVHQQLIGEKFRQYNNANPQDEVLRSLSFSGVSQNVFRGDNQIISRLANKGVTIPAIDDWLPLQGTVPSGTLKVFTALASISEEDKKSLLNIQELGDFLLVPKVIEFMAQSEFPYMTGHATSIFQVTVYEGHDVLEPGQFEVDGNLNVVAIDDLDLRKMYHVRLGINANIASLTSEALGRLRAWPDMAALLAAAINGALTNSGSDYDLKKNALNAHDLALLGLSGVMPSTYGYSLFQTLFIVSKRMENYSENDQAAAPDALARPFVSI